MAMASDAPAGGPVEARAEGNLWKYDQDRDEWKEMLSGVCARIVNLQDDGFGARFEVLNKMGNVMFGEPVTNELRLQFNKADKSMAWALWDNARGRVDLLSFVFHTEEDERKFKTTMAVKLFEHNRQEQFAKVIKAADAAWVHQSLEGAAEAGDDDEDSDSLDLDDRVEAQDCTPMDISDDEAKWDEEDDFLRIRDGTKGPRIREARAPAPSSGITSWVTSWFTPAPAAEEQRAAARGHNTHITGSKNVNRSFVVRQTGKGAMLRVYKHGDDDELEPLNQVALQGFTPAKVQQHGGGKNLLFLSEEQPDAVHIMDLNRGAVVDEWRMPNEEIQLRDLNPTTKHGDKDGDETLLGLTSNAMFMVDGRTKERLVQWGVKEKCKTYAKDPKFTAIRTTGQGFFATAAEDGQLRLYSELGKIAKTALPGLGDKVKDLDVTEDGQWLLATCKDYLMLVPTAMPDGEKTGFQARMGQHKPRPYVLRLRHRDLAKNNIKDVDFTPARFDVGNKGERWIVTSTGPFLVKWDLRKIQRTGNLKACSIRRAKGDVVGSEFRFGGGGDLLVSEQNDVYAQHSAKARRHR